VWQAEGSMLRALDRQSAAVAGAARSGADGTGIEPGRGWPQAPTSHTDGAVAVVAFLEDALHQPHGECRPAEGVVAEIKHPLCGHTAFRGDMVGRRA
jgi:hypothetical protein